MIRERPVDSSAVLQICLDLGPRWKAMLAPSAPGAPPPNMRNDLHLLLEVAAKLGVPLPVAAQASHTADGGVATGHGDPRL